MRTYSVTIGPETISFMNNRIIHLVTLTEHTDCDTVLETHYSHGYHDALAIAHKMQTEIHMHANDDCPIHDNSQEQ